MYTCVFNCMYVLVGSGRAKLPCNTRTAAFHLQCPLWVLGPQCCQAQAKKHLTELFRVWVLSGAHQVIVRSLPTLAATLLVWHKKHRVEVICSVIARLLLFCDVSIWAFYNFLRYPESKLHQCFGICSHTIRHYVTLDSPILSIPGPGCWLPSPEALWVRRCQETAQREAPAPASPWRIWSEKLNQKLSTVHNSYITVT